MATAVRGGTTVRRKQQQQQLLGGGNHMAPHQTAVCKYWLAGRCTRNPCRFLHTQDYHNINISPKSTWRSPNYPFNTSAATSPKTPEVNNGQKTTQETPDKAWKQLCKYWVTGNCVYGDKCEDLHSWFCGNGFSMLTKLEQGHHKVITGIALPSGSTNLYTSGKDKSLRVWDCNTGKCADVIDLGVEPGCLINEGPWLFVGLPNTIMAWNSETKTELVLNGFVGQVYSMVMSDNNVFFAGIEDGTILAWKYSSETNNFEPVGSFKGHNRAVLSLAVGSKNRLYSGSMDKTIKIWDHETGQCLQTLSGHTDVVMSVLCWDSYLLSCSLDQTIKVWAATESGNVEEVYERNERHGVLALFGMYDAEAKPILLCSCNDNTVRLYDLPSFDERGRIYAKREVRTIQIGPGGLFFTGDALGQLFVWKLDEKSSAGAS